MLALAIPCHGELGGREQVVPGLGVGERIDRGGGPPGVLLGAPDRVGHAAIALDQLQGRADAERILADSFLLTALGKARRALTEGWTTDQLADEVRKHLPKKRQGRKPVPAFAKALRKVARTRASTVVSEPVSSAADWMTRSAWVRV